jgi:hypothetical protein
VRRREGRRSSKDLEALSRGFDGEGLNSPRYWKASGEQSPWIDGRSRERKESKMGRGTRGERGGVDSVPFGPLWRGEVGA